MVTLNKIREFGANRNVLSLVALTTDTIPVDTIEGMKITNGSECVVLDPSTKTMKDVLMFDEENRQWCKL